MLFFFFRHASSHCRLLGSACHVWLLFVSTLRMVLLLVRLASRCVVQTVVFTVDMFRVILAECTVLLRVLLRGHLGMLWATTTMRS